MKRFTTTALAVLVALGAGIAHAQGRDEPSRTITLPASDHPLNGTWQVMHGKGTVTCPQMSMPIPAGNPNTVRMTVHDGGARLEVAAPEGDMTLRRVRRAEWESESNDGMQILRRTMRTDNAALMAWAVEGEATIYEGTQATGVDGMAIHYILGWQHDEIDVLRGHLTSSHQGCRISRPFQFSRAS